MFFPLKEYSWDIFSEPCRHPEWSFLMPSADFLSFARPGYTFAFFAKLSKPDRLNDLAECGEVARAAWRRPSAQTDAVRQQVSPQRDRWESSVHLIKGVLSSWAHPGRLSAFWRTRWPARVCASTVKMFCECHLPEFMSELLCFDSDPLSASSARMTVSRG